MIKVVSWNVGKRAEPWHELVQMARDGDADVALGCGSSSSTAQGASGSGMARAT